MSAPTFTCPKHGEQFCMVVCLHCIAGSGPKHLQAATDERNGEAYCKVCAQDIPAIKPEFLLVVCHLCFHELAEHHLTRIQSTKAFRYGVPN